MLVPDTIQPWTGVANDAVHHSDFVGQHIVDENITVLKSKWLSA